MPDGIELQEPAQERRLRPIWDEALDADIDDPYVVILYNDDVHSIEEVIEQIQLATGYDTERCIYITLEAHLQGRAITYTGSESECERVARVLRRIRLQCETDRF